MAYDFLVKYQFERIAHTLYIDDSLDMLTPFFCRLNLDFFLRSIH